MGSAAPPPNLARRASVMPAAPRSWAASGARWSATGACRSASAPSPAWRFHRDERGPSPSGNRCRCSSVGARRLAPRGHGELHALAAHGDRGLQRGWVAGGHGGCGERATGCLGSARVRGVAMASRIAEMAHSARNEVGGGIGGEDGRRTRAFARGERHDAGGDMRSRLVGGVHAAWDSHRAGRGVPRADRSARQFTLFAWKIFWIRRNPDVRGELPKPEARPRVRELVTPTRAEMSARAVGLLPRGDLASRPASSVERDGTPGRRSRPRPPRTRACVSPAASGECRSGHRHAMRDRRPVSLRRGPPVPPGGTPGTPSPGKPSTRRLPRTPRRPPRSTRAP